MKQRLTCIATLTLWAVCVEAQVTYITTTSADAFVATGSPDNPFGADLTQNNYGGAGTLVIAPASSTKGEFQSIIRFDLSGAVDLFNSTYGNNRWVIRGIALELTSNYGTNDVQPNNPLFNAIHNGSFVVEWLSDDSWEEGTGTPNLATTDGVTYDSLQSVLSFPHEKLCTNEYIPPGNNVHVTWPLPLSSNLVADATAGGNVSFRFYAADNQINYLFNSRIYGRGNEPLIRVSAIPDLKILSGNFTNGAFRLSCVGGTNAIYEIQAVSDLHSTNWQALGSATTDSAGVLQFYDTNASNQSQCFYRLRQP